MEILEKFVNRMTDKHDQIAKEVDEHADRPAVIALWEGAKTSKVNPRSCTRNLEMQLGTTVLANP